MSKQDIIHQQIRERILNGYYKPGDPIVERIVAEELGASRVPVRAALLQLEKDGLVTSIPNRGVNVRVFNPTDLRNLYVARMAIDGMAARLAALYMEPHLLDHIENEFRNILNKNEAPDDDIMASLGKDFHDTITSGCGNPEITRLAVSIADQVSLSKQLYFPHVSPSQMLNFAKQHIQILEAIKEREPDLAETLMRQHIAETYDLFKMAPISLGLKL